MLVEDQVYNFYHTFLILKFTNIALPLYSHPFPALPSPAAKMVQYCHLHQPNSQRSPISILSTDKTSLAGLWHLEEILHTWSIKDLEIYEYDFKDLEIYEYDFHKVIFIGII